MSIVNNGIGDNASFIRSAIVYATIILIGLALIFS